MAYQRVKRLRHPGGVSTLFERGNVAGEWALKVVPENVLIDNSHAGRVAHIHDPRDPRRRVLLGRLTINAARAGLVRHLRAHGRIDFERLVWELSER